MKHELDTTDAIPTNHSTIFSHLEGELARRILAYDLPIGRADSFSNRRFWKQLIKQADWLEPGSDAAYEKGGDFKADPPPPSTSWIRRTQFRPITARSLRIAEANWHGGFSLTTCPSAGPTASAIVHSGNS
ncbi:effector protein Tle3 domain-containing protein [Burkholderia ubonensis]|uniref:effector protein Tle3 domain-containing protein n=1 Tax=Burkholderia ubonensis TaxID=101571 RepID=UPI002108C847|nr:DUF3274 domain-containing protein [Burkholderia ubonensis]